MQALHYILLAFAPGLFWLWLLRHKDDLEPEPKLKVLLVFALGCLSTWPVLLIRPSLTPLLPAGDGPWSHFVNAFLVTAVPEEFWKIVAFLLGTCWHRDLDEPLDGVIYGTAAGLGFASVENVLYLCYTDQASLALLRGVTAVPMHVATTGAFAFFLGLIRFPPRRGGPWTRSRRWQRALPLAALGAFLAVGFHGAYDCFLFLGQTWPSLLGLLPLALVLLSLKIRWARARSGQYHPRA